MTGGEKLLVAGAVGVGLIALFKAKSANAVLPPPGYNPGIQAPLDPVTNTLINTLPFLKPAYAVLNPVNSKLVQPLVQDLNQGVSHPINNLLGSGGNCPPTYSFKGHVTGDYGAAHTFPLKGKTNDGRCIYDTTPSSGSPQIIVNPNLTGISKALNNAENWIAGIF